jgi:hypothetical protein
MTSITTERAKLAEVGLVLRRREQWGARFDYTTVRSVDEPADHQFVHITITNPGNYATPDRHAQAVEAIGISRFPNTGISYNRMTLPGGLGYEGQPIGRRGAHTVNDDQRSTCNTTGCPSIGRSLAAPAWNNNVNSRAYVMARNCGDPITAADLDMHARMIAGDRLAGFVVKNATLHGHRCCSDKSCPCDPMWGFMDDLADAVSDYLRNGDVSDVALTTDDKTWIKAAIAAALNDDHAEMAKAVWGTDGLIRNVNQPATLPDGKPNPAAFARASWFLSDIENTGDVQGKTLDEHGKTLDEIKAAVAATPPGSTVVSDLTDPALAKLAKAVADEEARRLGTAPPPTP